VAEPSWPGEGLVAAAQRGDVDAIAALVRGSHPHVRRFARSLCATPEDAEDAAQEALIVLYRRVGTLRASGALASWMFRIVRNECLRRARTMSRDHPPRPEAAVVSAEEEVLRRLEAEAVAAAIAALPDDQRRVLIMRDVQGHGGRMVAEALGLSTAAMKSRLHRARAAVRHDLRPVTGPAPGGNDDRTEACPPRLREHVPASAPGPWRGGHRRGGRRVRPHARGRTGGPAAPARRRARATRVPDVLGDRAGANRLAGAVAAFLRERLVRAGRRRARGTPR
jgi:RNA polymerase sigma factor (sigma-70 family)